MKKIISLVLAVCIIVTTLFSLTITTSADDSAFSKYNVAITQLTGNYLGAAAKQNFQGSTITAYDYSYGLSAYGWSGTWRQSLVFFDAATETEIKLKAGAKYIVNMEYTIDAANDGWGLQMGLFGGIQSNGVTNKTTSTRPADYIAYKNADIGKTFTTANVFTATADQNIGLQFAGQGTVTFKSITLWELPAEYITDYATVTYIDDGATICEFAKKNSTPKNIEKFGYKFNGWYESSDFSGETVTDITKDITLYANWKHLYSRFNVATTQLTGNYLGAASKQNFQGSTITAYDYSYGLSAYGWSGTWRQSLVFFDEATETEIKLKAGAKYIVNMEYTIDAANDGWGLQMGLFGGIQDNGVTNKTTSTRPADYIAYKNADIGKTFTTANIFTATTEQNIGLQFAGQGTVTFKSITLWELPVENIDDCAAVTYVDNGAEIGEFVEINSAAKRLVSEEKIFAGWYTESDFSGNAVTTITEDVVLYAKWSSNYTQYSVATTQLTGNYLGAAAKQNFQGSTITAYDYSYGLGSYGWSGTWRQSLVFFDEATATEIKLKAGAKYIVNMEYTIDAANDGWGLQIGLFSGIQDNGITNKTTSTRPADYIAYKNADIGKTFTTANVFTATAEQNIGLQFAGQGTVTFNSITLWELPSERFETYSIVLCKNDTAVTGEVIKNGSAISGLPRTLLHNFGGWYNGEEKVTYISSNVTLTAKWFDKFDVNMDNSNNILDLIRLKKSIADTSLDLIYDVDRDNGIGASDATALTKDLLGVESITINGEDIAAYTVVKGDKASFLTANATQSLVETFNRSFDVDLLDSTKTSSKRIVVGILNIDDNVAKNAALENLVGVKGDVYGLNDYKIFLYEDDLYIESGSDYATAYAVNKFIDFIKKYKLIPPSFELSGKYNGQKDLLDGYSYAWGDEFNQEKLNTEKWFLETKINPGPYYEKTNSYYLGSVLSGNKYGGPWIDVENLSLKQDGTIEMLNEEGNNYYLQDGLLVMKTGKTDTGYYGTKINAKKSFKYGIMTARVKLATKNGACSTLWSRTVDDNGASVNEFDYVENFGADQIVPNLHTWVNYTDHTNHSGTIDKQETIYPVEGESLSDSFHEISLYWDEEKIVFYFDGVAYLEQDIASNPEKWEAFHKSTYMIMGVSAPSDYYGTYHNGTTPGDVLGSLIDSFSETYSVDYIRVFQK